MSARSIARPLGEAPPRRAVVETTAGGASDAPPPPASSARPIHAPDRDEGRQAVLDPAAPLPPGDWYVCVAGGETVGPVRAELVVQGLVAGRVPPDAYALRRGSDRWTPVLEIPLFVRALERITGTALVACVDV